MAAEDTRVTGRLLSLKGLKKPLARLDEHAPDAALEKIVDQIASGKVVVFASDAGTPAVSDPGARLVDLAYASGVEVDAIPGASAVTNALALSGFFAQRFAFLGFLPRKTGAQRAEFEAFRDSTYTLVIFESAERTPKMLESALAVLGDRRVAICREMTKMHQGVLRGRLSVVFAQATNLKGEVSVVIEGVRRNIAKSP